MTKRFLFMTVVVSLLLAVGTNLALAQKKPVVIDVYGVQWLPGHLEVMTKLVDDWNKTREDIKINWIRGQWVALRAMLITGTAAGNVPDLVNLNEWSAREFGARGAFTRLNDLLDQGVMQKLHPVVKEAGTDVKGNMWMLAHEWEVDGMVYYNPKILKEAGVDVPAWNEIWTYEKAREVLKKVADPSKGRAGLIFRYPRNDKTMEWWLPLVWQEGAEVIKYDDKKKPRMDLGEPADKAMTYFDELIKVDKTVPAGIMGTTTDSELAAFLDGKTAFVIEGGWFRELIKRAAKKDFEWGMMHPWRGKRQITALEAVGWSMSSTVKDKKAAWEVMWYLTASKGMAAYNKKGMLLPTALENLADPMFQSKEDYWNTFYLATKSGRTYPNHPMIYQFGNNLMPEITQWMIEGKVGPKEAVRILEKEGTHMIGEFE
jgi:ABC-type glycerol-3-phosphate transport system substrate-binding protein